MKKQNKRQSLTWQFITLLILSGLFCTALFAAIHFPLQNYLLDKFNTPEFQKQATEKRIIEFQEYVERNRLSVSDQAELAEWVKKNPLLLMETYRSNVLVFTSFAPDNDSVFTNDAEVPYYEWMVYYIVEFADGEADVLLYNVDGYRYLTYATMFEILLCVLVFLCVFLYQSKKVVRYIQLLNQKILVMESGDLESVITVKGNNELTTLAQGLDSMREAFRAQQEREAQSFASNQALISEMSHDLRTPLTSLLLYTEILRYAKVQGEERMQEYLDKIDGKAQQIKLLSENILEYSLLAREIAPELEPPAPIEMVFEEALSETISELSRHGFLCQAAPFGEPVYISVRSQYIRRIMDNILSNILKYADKAQPITIQPVETDTEVGLTVANTVSQRKTVKSGTQIGIKSIYSLMEKMGGSCQVEHMRGNYQITLLFPMESKNRESQKCEWQ